MPLPLPREEYVRDFQSDESKREFDDLLSQAREVMELGPSESREKAYERVGHYVVDRCDVLIAVWDGQPSRGRGVLARSWSMREATRSKNQRVCSTMPLGSSGGAGWAQHENQRGCSAP